MTKISLDSIRDCLEGAVPSVVATCAADGTPNVSFVSHVHYVDREHVALSFQFFNKTRANVLVNPLVRLLVTHPVLATTHALDAEYLRTETEGAVFERMRAHLACIAAQTGMSHVFRLRGADVYRVRAITLHHGEPVVPLPARSALAGLSAVSARIARASQLDELLDETLEGLARAFDVDNAMVLVVEPATEALVLVASRGYPSSGAGAEVRIGEGVIGIAARERTAIRLTHAATERAYARQLGEPRAVDGESARTVPFIGLTEPASQLAVPIVTEDALAGVLFVESAYDRRFGHDDEDALSTLAAQLGAAMKGLSREGEREGSGGERGLGERAPLPRGAPARVRYYPADDSVFVDGDYLIKGVAGAILWTMLSDHAAEGRVDFTNRELRLDPRLRLPELADNLEARLVLLSRRLTDRVDFLRIDKTGRGRMRLVVTRPLALERVE